MKKSLFAVLGLAGACVACCTIPLAIPLLGGGAAALGLASWLGFELNLQTGVLLLVAFLLVAAAGYGVLLWARRRQAAACASPSEVGASCSMESNAQGCGC